MYLLDYLYLKLVYGHALVKVSYIRENQFALIMLIPTDCNMSYFQKVSASWIISTISTVLVAAGIGCSINLVYPRVQRNAEAAPAGP